MNTTNNTFPKFSLTTISLALMLSIGLTACGGGGVNAPSANNFSPADGASAVELDATVSATFDRDMFSITVVDTNFTLENSSGEAIAASVDYDVLANTVNLNPDADLSLLTQYTANLKSGITDLDGNPLADTRWQFTTRDGRWQTVDTVSSTNNFVATSPIIAIDNKGNALAIWHQRELDGDNLWTNYYTPSGGWETPQLMEGSNLGRALFPQLAFDNNGNALAVWRQFDGVRNNIWSNRYIAGQGWDTADMIEDNDVSGAGNPQIAIDNNGDAIAVWEHSDGILVNIWANRYVNNSGWGNAEIIEGNDAGSASRPQIAFDSNGNALVVWEHHDGVLKNIWSNRYDASNGWGEEIIIEEPNPGDDGHAREPQIAMDSNGNALVVWYQHNNSNLSSIWSTRYDVNNGWSDAQLIETVDTGNALFPKIDVNSSGNALAVWKQNDGIRDNILSNHFTPGIGWGEAQLIETNDILDASDPQITIDNSGNALAVWTQSDRTNVNVWFNRYRENGGWGRAQLVEFDNEDTANAKITVGSNGHALAVWQQNDPNLPTKIKSNSFK